MYSPLRSWSSSGKWKRGWTREQLRLLRSECCGIEEKGKEVFSPFCVLGLQTKKLYFLDHLAEGSRSFEETAVLNASVYEIFNNYIKRIY